MKPETKTKIKEWLKKFLSGKKNIDNKDEESQLGVLIALTLVIYLLVHHISQAPTY